MTVGESRSGETGIRLVGELFMNSAEMRFCNRLMNFVGKVVY